MITPAIPVWLSENLWKGLRFDDMEETARKWMKIIREQEKPDLVIGMFHAGQDAQLMGGKYRENASVEVACNVPGFDIVLMGHDHARECKRVCNIAGDSVLVMDPASNGVVVSNVDITLKLRDGKVIDKKIDGILSDTQDYGVSEEFMQRFAPEMKLCRILFPRKLVPLPRLSPHVLPISVLPLYRPYPRIAVGNQRSGYFFCGSFVL